MLLSSFTVYYLFKKKTISQYFAKMYSPLMGVAKREEKKITG
jgi:hypothetical protein